MLNTFAPARVDSAAMARRIEDNLSAKSLDFARLPGGQVHLGNPTWFTSGFQRVGYNGVTSATFDPGNVDRQIDQALDPFRRSATPLTWWVGPLSEPGNLGRALQLHGFTHNRDMIGMAAELDTLAGIPTSELEYHFEPVLSRADLKTWLSLFMETFSIPAEEDDFVLDVFDQLSLYPNTLWRHYMLCMDGEVVATSSLHFGAGVAGLYNIATRPSHRQHGLGTIITLLTYDQARQMGHTVGTLQTTYPNALRLYHRMGFEVYCKIGVYQHVW